MIPLLQMIGTFLYSFISGLGAFITVAFEFKPLYDIIGDVKNMVIADLTGLSVGLISAIGALLTLFGIVKILYKFVTNNK